MKSTDRIVDDVISRFDFDTVAETMARLRWRWTVSFNPRVSAVPTAELIKVRARQNLEWVARQPKGTTIRQGGLMVVRDKCGALNLAFEEHYPRCS